MACADLPDTDASPDAIADFLEKAQRGQLPNCDYQTVLTILEDMSNFPQLADRVQQGLVNFLYLGRLMIHPDGFSSDPNFQVGGQSLIDTRRLFYDGNSQGGIIGGALTAVAVDHDRAVLGVPGMNYSTLLTRSTDWGTGQQPSELDLPEYSWFMYEAYPNELERQLIFSLIQTLWDRAEANGYAHHMTDDPLPNTPPHEVMLHVGLGDHQVAQVAAEVEARTIGAFARTPYVDAGRDSDVDPHYAIPGDPELPVRRLRARPLGHRAEARRERRDGRHRGAAHHEHAAGRAGRRGPARVPAPVSRSGARRSRPSCRSAGR